MRIEVAFSPLGLGASDVAGRSVAVIDVLRATTTICAALHHGARAVIPAADTGEALRLAEALDRRETLLAGERNCEPIPGFALGNSPLEMTSSTVGGRTLVMTTTNGTRALLATAGARDVAVIAACNLSVAAPWLRQAVVAHDDLLVLCAGRENGFSLDDAYVAGRCVIEALGGRRSRTGLNDAAIVCVDLVRRYGARSDRPLFLSRAGRELVARGYRADVDAAAVIDQYPVLPMYHDRRVTRTLDAAA